MDYQLSLKFAFAVVASFVGNFFGGWSGIMTALLTAMVVDYLTGVMAASVTGKVSSKAGFAGIFKKVSQLLLVGFTATLDMNVFTTSGGMIHSTVIYFLIANEGFSILENMDAMGIQVPGFLRDILAQAKEKGEPKQ